MEWKEEREGKVRKEAYSREAWSRAQHAGINRFVEPIHDQSVPTLTL